MEALWRPQTCLGDGGGGWELCGELKHIFSGLEVTNGRPVKPSKLLRDGSEGWDVLENPKPKCIFGAGGDG